MPWFEELQLRGAGGEPVDFARTLVSHGVADLPPNDIERDGSGMDTVLRVGRRAWLVELSPAPRGGARVSVASGSPPATITDQVRHMLRLDEDLSAFYLLAAEDPTLAWSGAGAGRLLRSPTVFEDLVKTICTTNTTWSATVRMVTGLVSELGIPAVGNRSRRAFPTPEAIAQADDDFFKEVAKAGYRGAYLRSLATDVAEGREDLEQLNDPALPDDEVAERLLAIAGVGPYATAQMMMLLGRYRRLILDSWTRPTYRRISGRTRVTDKGIQRAFRRYGQFAGLAFWLTLTEDWISQPTRANAGRAGAPSPARPPKRR